MTNAQVIAHAIAHGKRGPLKEVSSLRPYSVNLAEVDLSQLLGGDTFTLSYIISNNGLGIKTSSLIDTRANRNTFIDSKFVKTIKRFLGIEPVLLEMPCNVRGFNGKQATPITHYVKLSLRINGR